MHGGDIYTKKVKVDFSVNINPFYRFRMFPWEFRSLADSFSKYPDVESHELKKSIGCTFDIDSSCIITGNGASEIILSFVRAINPRKGVVVDPCFSGYTRAMESIGCEILRFSLKQEDGFEFTDERISDYFKFIDNENPSVVFLCNPNNPNGRLVPYNRIAEIIEHCKKLGIHVFLDECFMNLTGKDSDFSLRKMIEKFENLFILDAFTKTFSIPGLRLGYGFCSNRDLLNKMKLQFAEWNVSSVAQKVGVMCLRKFCRIRMCSEKIIRERNFLIGEMKSLGLHVFSSDSNFILFYCDRRKDLDELLLNKGILIRNCSDYENLGEGFFRIAVRRHSENKLILREMKKILGENCNGKD